MLLVIHNLPKNMGFYNVKKLIQDKCGLNEVILDNFTLEGDYKRVTVGLADEGDAALLVRKINGLYMEGSQLYVEDVRQKKLTEQPYRPIDNPHVPQLRPEKKGQYDRQDAGMAPQPMIDAQPMFDAQQMINAQPMMSMPPVQMAYSNLPFYMSPAQTPYTNYENHAAQGAITPQPQVAYFQTPIQQPVVENQWTSLPAYASYPNKPHRLPDVNPISNSRDWQSKERRHSRSPSPARFSVPNNEPQWRDRKITESSRREQGWRSPGRHREMSGKTPIHKEFDGRSERDRRERSPARRRDEGNRSSRREEDAMRSKHPSHIERSPPRDRDFDTRKREDRRQYDERERFYDRNEKSDYRDREPKRSSDRYEKPRNYDKHYEPRYNKPIVEQEKYRNFGNKRPYTNVSQSSRTYGNDPDNCTFSVSNASIFEKHPIARKGDSFRSKGGDMERESFDHKVPAKRSRFDGNKVVSGPIKVDKSKPTSAYDPNMRKMIIRHNNWRYQVASIIAKQIMSAARGPGAFPNYANIYKKLKECVVARIDVCLGDTIVRTLMEMTESYRSRFPPEDDVTFFNAVLEKIEREEQEAAADQVKENTSEVESNEKVTTGASDIEDNAAKDANLMPPPSAPAQIPRNSLKKKRQKLNYQEDCYDVEPLLEQAIEDEIAPMLELYSKPPKHFMKNTDHKIYKTIVNETTHRFKKVLKMNLTKRVLDITGGGGLGLQIHPVNGWPDEQLFDEWTKKYGILRVNKHQKMYVVFCDSYLTYDEVAALDTFTVGDVQMKIVTAHFAGKQKNIHEEKRERKLNKQQETGGGDSLLLGEDAETAGIDNTIKNEGIDDEEEDTHNADATEHDDVVIVEQEKEVVLIEDDDVTNTEGDVTDTQGDEDGEGTELTEGVDAGSGDQNDCIDNADNHGSNVESMDKGNEETAENVEALQNEQTNEEYLEKGESLEMGENFLKNSENTLEKGEETIETGEGTQEKSEEPSEIPETDFGLTGDNLEADITDDIPDDDLEDF